MGGGGGCGILLRWICCCYSHFICPLFCLCPLFVVICDIQLFIFTSFSFCCIYIHLRLFITEFCPIPLGPFTHSPSTFRLPSHTRLIISSHTLPIFTFTSFVTSFTFTTTRLQIHTCSRYTFYLYIHYVILPQRWFVVILLNRHSFGWDPRWMDLFICCWSPVLFTILLLLLWCVSGYGCIPGTFTALLRSHHPRIHIHFTVVYVVTLHLLRCYFVHFIPLTAVRSFPFCSFFVYVTLFVDFPSALWWSYVTVVVVDYITRCCCCYDDRFSPIALYLFNICCYPTLLLWWVVELLFTFPSTLLPQCTGCDILIQDRWWYIPICVFILHWFALLFYLFPFPLCIPIPSPLIPDPHLFIHSDLVFVLLCPGGWVGGYGWVDHICCCCLFCHIVPLFITSYLPPPPPSVLFVAVFVVGWSREVGHLLTPSFVVFPVFVVVIPIVPFGVVIYCCRCVAVVVVGGGRGIHRHLYTASFCWYCIYLLPSSFPHFIIPFLIVPPRILLYLIYYRYIIYHLLMLYLPLVNHIPSVMGRSTFALTLFVLCCVDLRYGGDRWTHVAHQVSHDHTAPVVAHSWAVHCCAPSPHLLFVVVIALLICYLFIHCGVGGDHLLTAGENCSVGDRYSLPHVSHYLHCPLCTFLVLFREVEDRRRLCCCCSHHSLPPFPFVVIWVTEPICPGITFYDLTSHSPTIHSLPHIFASLIWPLPSQHYGGWSLDRGVICCCCCSLFNFICYLIGDGWCSLMCFDRSLGVWRCNSLFASPLIMVIVYLVIYSLLLLSIVLPNWFPYHLHSLHSHLPTFWQYSPCCIVVVGYLHSHSPYIYSLYIYIYLLLCPHIALHSYLFLYSPHSHIYLPFVHLSLLWYIAIPLLPILHCLHRLHTHNLSRLRYVYISFVVTFVVTVIHLHCGDLCIPSLFPVYCYYIFVYLRILRCYCRCCTTFIYYLPHVSSRFISFDPPSFTRFVCWFILHLHFVPSWFGICCLHSFLLLITPWLIWVFIPLVVVVIYDIIVVVVVVTFTPTDFDHFYVYTWPLFALYVIPIPLTLTIIVPIQWWCRVLWH